MDAAAHVEMKARAAKEASRLLALAPTRTKNEALAQMARGLEERTAAILDANRHDLERARAAGHARAFVDRLTLTEGRVEEMATGSGRRWRRSGGPPGSRSRGCGSRSG